MPGPTDHPNVRIPPPIFLLAAILAGVGLKAFHPLPFLPHSLRWILASVLTCGGLGVILHCAWTFRKAGTALEPWKQSSRLVTTGIYGLSRNPIYGSFVLIGLGMACGLNNLWILLMQGPLVLLLDRLVIAKEEAYLEARFGEEYRAYKSATRRWI